MKVPDDHLVCFPLRDVDSMCGKNNKRYLMIQRAEDDRTWLNIYEIYALFSFLVHKQ
jgi:hypothetical protein